MPETDRPARVWMNGAFVDAAAAHVPADDPGVLYGCGFFETFRTSGGQPHHWAFHEARLERACATAGILTSAAALARDGAQLREVVRKMLGGAGETDAVFRYTLTARTELLAMRPLPPAAPPAGATLRVLQLARDNGEWIPRPKSLNYLNAHCGAQELRRRAGHASDDGLFLAREGGWVVETTRQNLAWVADGQLCHPDPTLGAVAGTCLAWVTSLGLPMRACRAGLGELLNAEAVFTLNAVRGITPVRAIWDATDRAELRTFASASHPLVVSLRHQWAEALRATAGS